VLLVGPAAPARAQGFGGYGYPGYGTVYGFPGAAAIGSPAMGYGFGYPFGAYSVFSYPSYGFGGAGYPYVGPSPLAAGLSGGYSGLYPLGAWGGGYEGFVP